MRHRLYGELLPDVLAFVELIPRERRRHARPRQLLIRVEVERDAIGMLHVGPRRAPGMQLDGAVLHQRDQRAVRVDVDVVALARALALEGLHVAGARAHGEVALIEAGLFRAIGAAHQCQRPAYELRQDPVRHAVVVAREIELRDAEARPDEALRVRDLHAVHDVFVMPPCQGGWRGLRPSGGLVFRRTLRPLIHHRFRRNVLAQAEERGLPHDAVVGTFREGDLRHELRLHPLDAFFARRIGERRIGPRHCREALGQRAEPFLIEPRADLAGVAQLAAGHIVDAENQRTEAGSRAAGRGVADDDEVLLEAALELDPGLGAARFVDRVGALADQALEPELACLLEHLARLPFQVFAQAHAAGLLQRRRQGRFALSERQALLVDTLEERRVEHIEHDPAIGAGVEGVLQRLEARAAVLALHHDLAIEPGVVQLERLQRAHQLRQLCRPVLPAAREEPRIALGEPREHAITVVLDLIEPLTGFRRLADKRGELRRDELRQFWFLPVFGAPPPALYALGAFASHIVARPRFLH